MLGWDVMGGWDGMMGWYEPMQDELPIGSMSWMVLIDMFVCGLLPL